MPDDLVPPGDDDTPRGGLVCEFCDCSLTKAGEIKRLSPKAKKIRRLEEDLEKAQAGIVELQAAVASVRDELQAAQARLAGLPAARSGVRDWLADEQ